MISSDDHNYWCETNKFAELYRQSIALRRRRVVAADRPSFLEFLYRWHFDNIDAERFAMRYQFYRFDPRILEAEILPARGINTSSASTEMRQSEFHDLFSSGDHILLSAPDASLIFFLPRGTGNYYFNTEFSSELSSSEQQIYQFLKQNGMSMLTDIEEGIDISLGLIKPNLSSLIHKGLITCDDYNSYLSLFKSTNLSARSTNKQSIRQKYRNLARENFLLQPGRWFLTTSFGVAGKKRTREEQAEYQARLLLNRYGILVKEWYRYENDLLPWYEIFQILKKLEWQGEIRRGYFIEGLSGVQFATHEAVDLLENPKELPSGLRLISTVDPGYPFGRNISWNLSLKNGEGIQVVRGRTNHLVLSRGIPVVYLENFGLRVWLSSLFDPKMLEELAALLKNWLRLPAHHRPRKKIVIGMVNGAAPGLDTAFTSAFLHMGFEKDGQKLVLWPSGL